MKYPGYRILLRFISYRSLFGARAAVDAVNQIFIHTLTFKTHYYFQAYYILSVEMKSLTYNKFSFFETVNYF